MKEPTLYDKICHMLNLWIFGGILILILLFFFGCSPNYFTNLAKRYEPYNFVERSEITQSYLGFLSEQIALEPRGPAWTEVLRGRVSALAPHVGEAYILLHICEAEQYFAACVQLGPDLVIQYESSERYLSEQQER